jgi:hypothetical protein
LLHSWRRLKQEREQEPVLTAWRFSPFELYGLTENRGLIPWGGSERGWFYWLADDSTDPAEWPVIARRLDDEDWHRFEMSTAEFLYRVIADPDFQPFTIADPRWPPHFLPPTNTSSDPRATSRSPVVIMGD